MDMKEPNIDIAKGNFFDPHLGYSRHRSDATLERRGYTVPDGSAISA